MATTNTQVVELRGEPFQVVWRKLSFEVNVSTYDQTIGRALKRVRSIWKLNNKNKNYDVKQQQQSIESGCMTNGTTTTALGSTISGINEIPGLDLPSFASIDITKTSSSSFISPPFSSSSSSSNNSGSSSQQQIIRSNKRVIFENLNGYVNSGELSAILGPSGSGKTSLLNAICGRVENYRGSVQLIGGGSRRMRLSIIPQKDYLIENLTVKENLLYSSKILNTSKKFDHEGNILRVARMLNLTNCYHSTASSISGGEYKRVSIAQELLRQPDILILDEPTSGLDSLNCKNLIKSLNQLIEASRKGTINPIAIVVTIHQPDVDIFRMFDHVYCMARRGRCIFDGKPSEVLDVVRTHAGLLLDEQQLSIVPPNFSNFVAKTRQSDSDEQTSAFDRMIGANPANLLIEIASEDLYGQEPIERLAQFQRKQFDSNSFNLVVDNNSGSSNGNSSSNSNSKNSNKDKRMINNGNIKSELVNSSAHLVRDKRLNAKNDHSGQFWRHTGLLAKRAFTATIRDPLLTLISLMFHLTIPFVMWTVYSQKTGSVNACPLVTREIDMISMVSNNTMEKMEDMQDQLMTALECSTMFFLSTYSFSMCSLSVAALAFPLNMHVLLKEVRNGWYSLPSYVVAKTIANFPFEVLFPVISLCMIYLMLGMPSSYFEWRLGAMALVMALISMISHTQGLIFGALCMDSVQTAIFLASSATLPQTLLSGFTARIKQMPILLQRLSWFSLYRYSSDSINMIRFGFGMCPCDKTTDDYLRTKVPTITDVPDSMKPVFTYYLTTGQSPDVTATTIPSIIDNSTTMSMLAANSTNLSILSNNNNMTTNNFISEQIIIPGISYDLTLNATARAELLKRIENNEVDLFGQMAELMTRSFTYGHQVDSCRSVRSQLLTTADAPRDEFLPFMFGGMFALLVVAKLILFVIVKYKIGGRV